jgi:hypothetical protein
MGRRRRPVDRIPSSFFFDYVVPAVLILLAAVLVLVVLVGVAILVGVIPV